MTAMLDQAAADPQQIIADLQRKLDARTAELQEKNERYALVSQAVAEGIYDWDIARNALWVSPRLIEIFGWGNRGPTPARGRVRTGTPACTRTISNITARRCGRP